MTAPVEKIYNLNLQWKRETSNEKFYFVKVKGDIYHLRMNDFPEEIMFTLFENKKFVTNMESNPKNWKMPFDKQ